MPPLWTLTAPTTKYNEKADTLFMSNQPIYNNLYSAVWELQDCLEYQLNTNYTDLETQQKREATLWECKRIATAIDL